LVACLALISLACDIVGDDAPDPEAYRTPVAQAQAAGLTPYWLGPEFSAGGLSFDFIEGTFPQGVAGVRVNGLQLSYLARDGYTVRATADVLTFSKTQWATAADRVRYPAGVTGVTRKNVTVGGRHAELISMPLGARPVNSRQLIIEFDDAVVLGQTTAVLANDGRQINPLIDEQTFLSVMEQLRPYPQ